MSLLRSTGVMIGALLLVASTGSQANASSRIKTLSAPGCKWIGTRVVQSLIRDDIIAANEYKDMYKAMACPAKDLILGFSCAVKKITASKEQKPKHTPAPTKAGEDKSANIKEIPRIDKVKATKQIIDACWNEPRAK